MSFPFLGVNSNRILGPVCRRSPFSYVKLGKAETHVVLSATIFLAMGPCLKGFAFLFILLGVALAALIAYLQQPGSPIQIPDTGYWGPKKVGDGDQLPADDEKIYKFTVSYDAKMVAQLRDELGRTKWVEPLEDAAYHYGVNLNTFKSVIDYWKTKFDFKKAANDINAFPHFQTEIEGLKIHFFRSSPATKNASVKVLPLLMVHGWPGSFIEFLKVASQLSKPANGVAFDIIVPSIPGYGFSQASSKQGMNVLVTARIFAKLMSRLGYSKFYMQGGDWGSAITTAMSALYPERLRGIHLNMMFVNSRKPLTMAKMVLFSLFPDTFGDGHMPPCMPLPFRTHFLSLLRETGYLHIQATKPDTVGFGLLNSPAGLAAYILEKFSTWTQSNFRSLEDGGLTKKLSLDDLLANVMVYYASESIISSQRYYKENLADEAVLNFQDMKITVPTGYAIFPHEISCVPRFIATDFYPNITTMTYFDDGGHFAAFEKPAFLEKDIRSFVEEVEAQYPEKLAPPKGSKAVERK
ncbi:epoxide hydrolase 1-like [Tropilaelaps mercedesae]|uniref:Epoxide hydrolase 1-like n=1 Tax=Tropilaelaps mercedesae TaxID=418985 RepID=A0A1V9XL21_9ACAR|nr:epoxide hydrolase 1-like [Tropilaelaps mercedesae]